MSATENTNKRKRKLHVRCLRNLRHPKTGEPFLYIYMKKDGWFLASQLASHVFGVSLDCIMLRIKCAISSLSSNKRKYMRFSRCKSVYDPVILNQIYQYGVKRETMRKSRVVIDMHTTRLLIRSFDQKTNGKMFHLFEAILDLCFGPPDGLFHSTIKGNPLESRQTLQSIDKEKHYFQCSCGNHYVVGKDQQAIQQINISQEIETMLNQPRRKKRRNTRITASERFYVLSMFNYKCAVCKTSIGVKSKQNSGKIIPFEIDHRLERCRGGSNSVTSNLQPLCLKCHKFKTMDESKKPFEI